MSCCPRKAAAKLLMEQYWRSVARLAGWRDGGRQPTGQEIAEIQTSLEAVLNQKKGK